MQLRSLLPTLVMMGDFRNKAPTVLLKLFSSIFDTYAVNKLSREEFDSLLSYCQKHALFDLYKQFKRMRNEEEE